MKNILIITSSLSGGGTERVSVILANYLCDKSYNISIVVLEEKETTYNINKNINVYNLPNLKNKSNNIIKKIYYTIPNYNQIKNIIKNNEIIKIISFCDLPAILLLLLFKKIILISSKRNYPAVSSFLKAFLEKQIYNRSEAIVFQTSEQMNFYSKNIQKKGVIIPNPILDNLPMPYNGIREKEIITFCRITKQKNLLMLIDGFIDFYKSFPDYKLIIYGDSSVKDKSYKEMLINYIITNKMEDVIKINNFTHDIHNLILKSSCFVLTSDYEGLSNSMLESMAIGLPVICTDCKGGGAKAYIDNYENGILIPINDRNALTKALVFISSNPDKAKTMSEKAVKIKETLSNNKILEKWMGLL